MSRTSMVMAVFLAILALVAINTWISFRNASQIGKQFTVVCAEHRTLAKIAREETETLIENNKILLPKANIPGLSHQELVENSEHQVSEKQRHVAELQLVQKATC